VASNYRETSAPALGGDGVAGYQALLRVCNADEGLDLPFFFDEAASMTDAETTFSVWDDSILVGFGHLPVDSTPECCLMVLPNHRRQGVGTALLAAVRQELRRRGATDALLVADLGSASGRAFLSAAALPYRSSEFRLELDRTAIDRTRPPVAGLTMRVAERPGAQTLVDILGAAFGEDAASARDLIERGLVERTRCFYLAYRHGMPVGMLRAGEIEGFGDITAFGVRPECQGRGIGRQMLIDVIDLLTAAGLQKITLEVATENAKALGLYESCGFRVASEYGFYALMG